MNRTALRCPNCSSDLQSDLMNRQTFSPCRSCNRPVRADLFPRHFSDFDELGEIAEIAISNESVCYNHENKQADKPCGHCGRFVCSLCAIDLEAEVICPECLEEGERLESDVLINKRYLHGRMALYVSILPLFLIPFITFITAPVSIYIATKNWNAPGSLVIKEKWSYVVAIILSSIQILGWIVLGLSLFNSLTEIGPYA